jgi:hypothetical protein
MARGAGRPKKSDEGYADEKVRKQRKKKDKNAPKRALSAFMFFSNDIRDQVKEEMPGKLKYGLVNNTSDDTIKIDFIL